MTTVGSYHAKTHFSELLERVRKGEEIVITRRGVPIARWTPPPEPSRNIVDVLQEMKKLRKGSRLGRRRGQTLRELLHEGHRY